MCEPFLPNNSAAYFYRDGLTVQRLADRHAACAASGAPSLSELGVHWNAQGLAFPSGWRFQSTDMRQLERGYLLRDNRGIDMRLNSLLTQLFVAHDHDRAAMPPQLHEGDSSGDRVAPAGSGDAALLRGLHKQGFAQLDDTWGFARLLQRDGIGESIRAKLGALERLPSSRPGKIVTYTEKLPKLERELMSSKAFGQLRRAASAYLGAGVELSGYHAQRLQAAMRPWVSSTFHHDRCGQRLKLFIFLSKVTTDSHPTYVARGSHKTLWYWFDQVGSSRFAHDWVEGNYHVEPMVGNVGDGFILDTNAIHKGTDPGNKPRDVLIFEFNMLNKSRGLLPLSAGPCPSDLQYHLETGDDSLIHFKRQLAAKAAPVAKASIKASKSTKVQSPHQSVPARSTAQPNKLPERQVVCLRKGSASQVKRKICKESPRPG